MNMHFRECVVEGTVSEYYPVVGNCGVNHRKYTISVKPILNIIIIYLANSKAGTQAPGL
jgi:hypothetical protein